jgi:hypothetical protein
MIAPIGNIRIFVPGRTKGAAAEAAAALAEAVAAAIAAVLAASTKTPFTNVASLEASVVLAIWPEEVTADSVTTGMTRPCRVDLGVQG